MDTIVRKHIARILKYMVVQHLGWGGVMLMLLLFFLQYVISFYTSCIITADLKADA